MQLSRYFDLAATAYSSSSPVAEVDTQGCEGVVFIAVPGTTEARTGKIALKAGATTTGFVDCSTGNSFSSTGATHDVLVLDVAKPSKRWIGATYSATADMEARLIALKYTMRGDVSTFSATGVAHATMPSADVKRVISPTST